MNAKWCKRLRKILADLPPSTTVTIGFHFHPELYPELGTVKHEEGSFRRIYQDVKRKNGKRKSGILD
jgi:hypothetical protein